MAKEKKTPKPDAKPVGPPDELTRTVAAIRERFRKLVVGTYFPQKKVVEFLAYLDTLKPKAKAEHVAPKAKPIAEPERPDADATAGPSL